MGANTKNAREYYIRLPLFGLIKIKVAQTYGYFM